MLFLPADSADFRLVDFLKRITFPYLAPNKTLMKQLICLLAVASLFSCTKETIEPSSKTIETPKDQYKQFKANRAHIIHANDKFGKGLAVYSAKDVTETISPDNSVTITFTNESAPITLVDVSPLMPNIESIAHSMAPVGHVKLYSGQSTVIIDPSGRVLMTFSGSGTMAGAMAY